MEKATRSLQNAQQDHRRQEDELLVERDNMKKMHLEDEEKINVSSSLLCFVQEMFVLVCSAVA